MTANRSMRMTLVIWTLVTAACGFAQDKYGGGTGEPNAPYLIYTPQQMNAIGADPNDWDKHFKLMADLDLSEYTGTEFNLIGVRILRRSPADPYTIPGPFAGVFDGSGHSIRNFTWQANDENYVGLFRRVADPNATIKDLRMVDPNVTGQSCVGALISVLESGTVSNCSVQGGTVEANDHVGGLMGHSELGATIIDCYAEGNVVLGEWNVGGLLGYSNATLTDCRATSEVTGGDYSVGGLVGWYGSLDPGNNLASSGTMTRCHSSSRVVGESDVGGLAGINRACIADCHASGIVTGDHAVGGLVGEGWEGRIERCHASGAVSGDAAVGGLIGTGMGLGMGEAIDACYATGSVTGEFEVGGLAGCTGNDSITNCYATGSVTGGRSVGGLVGYCGSLLHCYSTGVVRGDEDVGGLVGKVNDRDGTIEGCFWDIDTSEQPESDAGSARTTADLCRAATFLGWGGAIWTIDDGVDCPRLWWEEQPGQVIQTVDYPLGSGTADDPFLIHTAEEMALIGWVSATWDKHFRLMADIDMAAFAGASFRIIGVDWGNPFAGVFDGNGHTISNFTYRSLDRRHIGVFGYVESPSAEIKNLTMVDPHVETGQSCQVGGMIGGLAEGTVANCCVDGGIVSGLDYRISGIPRECVVEDGVGGLVGNNRDGCIVNCYSTAAVMSKGLFYSNGGLLGRNGGPAANCYASGIVTGDNRTGGLVGYGGEVTASFWDVETSGQPESDGGTGLATAQMQDIHTYLDAGWDFFDETGNGTAETWYMPEDGGYPKLTVFAGYRPSQPEGEGTPAAPYLVSNAHELGAIGFRNTAYYRLDADIDLSEITWSTAVVPVFAGHFEGNGHVIRNLHVQGEGYLGLFGYITPEAAVAGVRLESTLVEGTGDYVGGLAGRSGGRIQDCFSRGSVTGNGYVGGLIGFLGEGSLSTSRSAGTVTGNGRVGGLVGYSDQTGILSNCYSTNSVIGGSIVGGLIGQSAYRGSVSYCYSAGPVSGEEYIGGFVGNASLEEMQACFWDMETSSQTSSRWAMGLTTAEMMMAGTFLEAGWDFAGETENGTDEIWWIDEGQDYPRLWWELGEDN